MKHISTLPDLGRPFELMKLQNDIAALHSHPSFWVQVMAHSVVTDRNQVIREIREQFHDNPATVRELIGDDIINRINRLYV